jgi:AcrR family transcriptional regulator
VTRSYDTPVRDQRRRATRESIQAAAQLLFVERGYDATSITAVARVAGVSAQTVYDAFGTKLELLRAAARSAAIGDEAERMLDESWLEAVAAEPHQWRRWVMLRDATASVLARTQPMAAVVRAAALSHVGVRELWQEMEEERRRDVDGLVRLLGEAGPLRVSHEEAVDLMWALSRSTDLYAALVVDRGWDPGAAFAAVSDAIARAILAEIPETDGGRKKRRR